MCFCIRVLKCDDAKKVREGDQLQENDLLPYSYPHITDLQCSRILYITQIIWDVKYPNPEGGGTKNKNDNSLTNNNCILRIKASLGE